MLIRLSGNCVEVSVVFKKLDPFPLFIYFFLMYSRTLLSSVQYF